MNSCATKRSAGLTITQLLITISVILILYAAATPILTRYTRQAKLAGVVELLQTQILIISNNHANSCTGATCYSGIISDMGEHVSSISTGANVNWCTINGTGTFLYGLDAFIDINSIGLSDPMAMSAVACDVSGRLVWFCGLKVGGIYPISNQEFLPNSCSTAITP